MEYDRPQAGGMNCPGYKLTTPRPSQYCLLLSVSLAQLWTFMVKFHIKPPIRT